MRKATPSQNKANSGLTITNTTGYKGVSWYSEVGAYRAYITINYKRIYLGFFDTSEKAHAAYCRAADRHFGEFANYG